MEMCSKPRQKIKYPRGGLRTAVLITPVLFRSHGPLATLCHLVHGSPCSVALLLLT